MAIFLFFILAGIPVVEILVFIEIGGRIGGLTTAGITILTAVMGGLLFRTQGFQALRQYQEASRQGENTLYEVLNALGLLLASICLFLPGFVTDVVGFLLFVPFVRIRLLSTLLYNLPIPDRYDSWRFRSRDWSAIVVEGTFEDISHRNYRSEKTNNKKTQPILQKFPRKNISQSENLPGHPPTTENSQKDSLH